MLLFCFVLIGGSLKRERKRESLVKHKKATKERGYKMWGGAGNQSSTRYPGRVDRYFKRPDIRKELTEGNSNASERQWKSEGGRCGSWMFRHKRVVGKTTLPFERLVLLLASVGVGGHLVVCASSLSFFYFLSLSRILYTSPAAFTLECTSPRGSSRRSPKATEQKRTMQISNFCPVRFFQPNADLVRLLIPTVE